MKSVSHEQALIFSFRNEPTLGVEYLKEVLKGGFTEELCIAIHRLDEAWHAIGWEHEDASEFSERVAARLASDENCGVDEDCPPNMPYGWGKLKAARLAVEEEMDG